ncbi:hypothetical protein NP233_g179 [Leucocoprinus birnbaumii]|uniref:Uncharacterized protein n=1 Tax=Leucocoprinus birnbaumii TaxID=56174 RepID=A0AAD5W4F8_9AGAR|nr:hypothetical protein NP233_g179 [Leucocoprinus birnbaumii]
MPQDLWRFEDDKIVFRRVLMKSDLCILQKYTSRVREIALTSNQKAGLSHGVYRALAMAYARRSIVPKLELLACTIRDPGLWEILPVFLNNGLKTLVLRVYQLSLEQLSFLVTLPTLSPNIKKLDVRLHPGGGFLLHNMPWAGTLIQWNTISTLNICYISMEDLLYIATMPFLKALQITHVEFMWESLTMAWSEIQESFANLKYQFPLLSSLKLVSFGPSSGITNIVKLLRPGIQVTDLSLCVHGVRETAENMEDSFRHWQELQDLVSAVNKHLDHSSLRSFSMEKVSFSPLATPFSIFSSLLKFSALKQVKLYIAPPIAVTLEEAEKVPSSWPQIEFLALSRENEFGPALTPLDVLLPLARGCPHLHTLILSMNTADENVLQKFTRHPELFNNIRNYALKRLQVASSPIRDQEFVALVLSEIYPSARIYCRHKIAAQQRMWEYVGNVLMPLICGVRKRQCEFLRVEDPAAGRFSEGMDRVNERDDEDHLNFGDDSAYIKLLEGPQPLTFEGEE